MRIKRNDIYSEIDTVTDYQDWKKRLVFLNTFTSCHIFPHTGKCGQIPSQVRISKTFVSEKIYLNQTNVLVNNDFTSHVKQHLRFCDISMFPMKAWEVKMCISTINNALLLWAFLKTVWKLHSQKYNSHFVGFFWRFKLLPQAVHLLEFLFIQYLHEIKSWWLKCTVIIHLSIILETPKLKPHSARNERPCGPLHQYR